MGGDLETGTSQRNDVGTVLSKAVLNALLAQSLLNMSSMRKKSARDVALQHKYYVERVMHDEHISLLGVPTQSYKCCGEEE